MERLWYCLVQSASAMLHGLDVKKPLLKITSSHDRLKVLIVLGHFC